MTKNLVRAAGSFSVCVLILAAGCSPRAGDPGDAGAQRGESSPPAAPEANHPADEREAPEEGSAPKTSPARPSGAGGPAAAGIKTTDEATVTTKSIVAGHEAGDVVDHRQLKTLLPESLAGLKRTSAKSEESSGDGFGVASAEADYESEPDAQGKTKVLSIRLIDTSGSAAAAAMVAGWSHAEIGRESDKDYEKTTTYSGRKAYEKYDKQSKQGEIKVLAGASFVVEVSGSNVTIDELKAALGKVDLAKLTSMKGAAPPK